MADSSGETNVPISEWSTGTLKIYHDEKIALLKEYFLALREDDQKAIKAASLATKEAILKAETASEKRFESVNEFRGQLADQTATLIPRAEADSRFNSLAEKVTDLTDRLNTMTGKSSGVTASWGYGVGAVGLVISAVALILAFNN